MIKHTEQKQTTYKTMNNKQHVENETRHNKDGKQHTATKRIIRITIHVILRRSIIITLQRKIRRHIRTQIINKSDKRNNKKTHHNT